VDAADLHLVLNPTPVRREAFQCGREAVIRAADCIGCGACLARCRFGAVIMEAGEGGDFFGADQMACQNCTDGCDRSCPVKQADLLEAIRATCGSAETPRFRIDPTACEGCGVCVAQCPAKAIDFPERESGEWFVSETRYGPLVHARLKPGGENSGKLVSQVRAAARAIAGERGLDRMVTDGPPGVGCAVIASLSGASATLVVTEPTLSGEHDLMRVLELARHFEVPAMVTVNKWDLNPDMTERIETAAIRAGARPVGRVRYGGAVTAAQLQGRPVVELESAAVAEDIREIWATINRRLEEIP